MPKTQRLAFGGITLDALEDWGEITEDVPAQDKPFTVAKSTGVGALQFSPALYRRGAVPLPSPADLLDMAESFGSERALGEPFDQTAERKSLAIGAAS